MSWKFIQAEINLFSIYASLLKLLVCSCKLKVEFRSETCFKCQAPDPNQYTYSILLLDSSALFDLLLHAYTAIGGIKASMSCDGWCHWWCIVSLQKENATTGSMIQGHRSTSIFIVFSLQEQKCQCVVTVVFLFNLPISVTCCEFQRSAESSWK